MKIGDIPLANRTMPGFKMQGLRRDMPADNAPKRVDPICLTLPYPPSVNLMYRAVNGRQILSSLGRKYKARVNGMGLLIGAAPFEREVVVSLWFYRPAKRGDLDNNLKATLDALKGVAFVDDRQVQQIHASRYDDKDNPRVEVVVSAAPGRKLPAKAARALVNKQFGKAFERLAEQENKESR